MKEKLISLVLCTILIKTEKFKSVGKIYRCPSQDNAALRLSALMEPVPRDEITEGENSRDDQNKVNTWCILETASV